MIDVAKSSLDFRFGHVLKQQFGTGIPSAEGEHGFGDDQMGKATKDIPCAGIS